jgi:MurNAc alpha-1-phosphate uridylyltransferase
MPDFPFPLMIFAAGFGTRMRHLTAGRPKPLVTVAGRALIDHALDLARAAGAQRIVVNTHYRADQMTAHLNGTGVLISHEPGPIL